MLKITTDDENPESVTMKICGRFTAEYVPEVEKAFPATVFGAVQDSSVLASDFSKDAGESESLGNRVGGSDRSHMKRRGRSPALPRYKWLASGEGGLPRPPSQVHGPNACAKRKEAFHEPTTTKVQLQMSYSRVWVLGC